MYQIPWKTKGIVLTAPQPYLNEVGTVAEFIERILAPAGVNLVVLQTRYRYQFRKHPECQGFDPLSYDDVKLLLRTCRRNGIRLVPKMNLFGHQSGVHRDPQDGILHGHGPHEPDFPDALLRAYPFLDEQYGEETVDYARCLCLTHPLLPSVLFDLIDELMDVFEADGMHIGCDEGKAIGKCPRCRDTEPYMLFTNHINMIHDHLAKRGAQTMIWSDRLLNYWDSGYNDDYESSSNGVDKAIDLVPKDLLCCDWHYGKCDAYRSVDIFADHGLRMMVCPWKNPQNTKDFLDYAVAHDRGHIDGYLQTTWCSSGELARHFLYGDPLVWSQTPEIVATMKEIFLP